MKLVQAHYTRKEVKALIAAAVQKAVKQERELLVQIIRSLPSLDVDVKQGWIENPSSLGRQLDNLKSPLIIDTDADPFCPDDWKVEEHQKAGKLEWNPAMVRLHLDPGQQNGKCVNGNELRKKLKNQPVLNAIVLDWLLAHPEFIPEEWKGKYVFFWGTTYRDSGGDLYVRYLYWSDGVWRWNCFWLGSNWRGNDPAVVAAS